MIAQAEHERLILRQTVWVAETDNGALVGFINAEVFERELHVWELSVHEAWQRKGVGKRLILSAYDCAAERGLAELTLTTFSDVPWCAPAYSKLGFQTMVDPGQRLRSILKAEAQHGLPTARRVAMHLPVEMQPNQN